MINRTRKIETGRAAPINQPDLLLLFLDTASAPSAPFSPAHLIVDDVVVAAVVVVVNTAKVPSSAVGLLVNTAKVQSSAVGLLENTANIQSESGEAQRGEAQLLGLHRLRHVPSCSTTVAMASVLVSAEAALP